MPSHRAKLHLGDPGSVVPAVLPVQVAGNPAGEVEAVAAAAAAVITPAWVLVCARLLS